MICEGSLHVAFSKSNVIKWLLDWLVALLEYDNDFHYMGNCCNPCNTNMGHGDWTKSSIIL